MITELIAFKKRAHNHNICKPLSDKWDRASSLREVADVGLNIQGIEFLCKGRTEGWGIKPSYLATEFAPYINGHYVHHSVKGYTSSLYCQHEGEVTLNSTNTCFIDCSCVVNVPQGHIRSLYIAGDCSISLFNEGYCNVVIYGDTEIAVNGSGRTHIKRTK